MKKRTLSEHLEPNAPKRILSLDGGGIRGVLTLEYLECIERILRERHGGRPDFRLCDYFDLIGGTSTGAIIAAALAMGYSVAELKTLYRELAGDVFKRSFLRRGLFVSKFPDEPLRAALERSLGAETTLGSDKLRTGLMVMTKRMDTGSPWPLHNNPRGRYFNPKSGKDSALANRDFSLVKVVRASTAAPTFFEPEKITVARAADGAVVDGAFVDGGVSPSNNPALQLLMLATIEGYGFRWPLGVDNLLLVSVGTGTRRERIAADVLLGKPAAELAIRALKTLMDDADALGQTLLQWMARTPTPWEIDREIDSLGNDQLGHAELLTYLRYNVHLDEHWMRANINIELSEKECAHLAEMDNLESVDRLATVGRQAASVQIQESHFPPSFDASA